ncbi:MAG: hypothetical protein ABFD64_13275 [Armatimonadota bacterium]
MRRINSYSMEARGDSTSGRKAYKYMVKSAYGGRFGSYRAFFENAVAAASS